MTRLLVDVQLEVLVVDQEAASLLEDRKVGVVPLRQQVHVVAMRQLGAHLDRLVVDEWPANRVNVGPVTLLAAFTQSRLLLGADGLQIVVDDLEVGELGELGCVGYALDCGEYKS